MATRTKPLVSAVALAGAAAVAVSTPAVAPNLNLPTPTALSTAAFKLTNVSDVLSVPAYVWTDVLFANIEWGGYLSKTNYGPEWAQPTDTTLPGSPYYPYKNPWAYYCDGGCGSAGIPGVAYLALSALVNGDGLGYDNYEDWKVGIVNYLFEPYTFGQIGGGNAPTFQLVQEGFSAAAWYAIRGTVGNALPVTGNVIDRFFWGTYNLTFEYEDLLRVVAVWSGAVPVVGPFVGNSIFAYLGELLINPDVPEDGYYQYGLSGTLNYWVDLVTGARTLFPNAGAGATTVVAAGPASAETAGTTDAATEANGDDSTAAGEVEAVKSESEDSASEAPKSEASESEASEGATEVEATDATEVEATDSTEVETTEAAEPTEVEATEVAATKVDEAPAAPKRPRPVRDAVEKVGKQINTAIANAKAAKAERVEARKAKAGAASAE